MNILPFWIEKLPKPVRIFLRRRLRPATTWLDGIQLDTSAERMPKLLSSMLYKENHENTERRLLKRHLTADDRVLELGGGIGFISLVCARICGAENVMTFEPNDAACALIERNYALNGMTPNLSRHAIATHDGELTFNVHDNIISSSGSARKDTREIVVPCRDVEKVLGEFSPSIVVMDIEGAEQDILPLVAVPGVRGMVVELHPQIIGEEAVAGLVQTMQECGFVLADRVDDKVVWFERTKT